MIEIGTERIALQNRIWIDGWSKWKVQGTTITSATPVSTYGHLYAKDVNGDGVEHIMWHNAENDEEFDLCHPPGGGDTTIIDQTIINEIINNYITNIVNNVNAPSTAGHLHGIQRIMGDGSTTTFELLDFAEYVDVVDDDGIQVDPAVYTLSEDRTQLAFTTAPLTGNVLQFNYVIARI